MAGLSIPSSFFSIIADKPIKAPVFPADIATSAFPSLTDFIQPHIEDSLPIFLMASMGFASIGTTFSQ